MKPAMPAQKVDPASKAPKFGPVSKPGIFLGYRFSGKATTTLPTLNTSGTGFPDPVFTKSREFGGTEGYAFPMLAAYERLTREVQLLDTGEGKGLPASSTLLIRVLINLVMPIAILLLTLRHLLMFLKGTDIMSMLGKLSSGMIHLHCLQEARPKRMWMTIESLN